MSTSQIMLALKAGVALAATAVLVWDAWSRREDVRGRRLRSGLLAAIGVAAFAGWWNFGTLHGDRYVHPHEFFHYYLGAKYHRELGYTRLYDCAAIAEAAGGRAQMVASRWIRNLETNDIEPASVALSDRAACLDRFSPSRWQEFVHDVTVLRAVTANDVKWNEIQVDHGYNASPVWTATGDLLTRLGPASPRQLLLLALVDPVILVLMWAMVWWAFGWRPLCLALIWWGTNYPARFSWTGGAFLRADWLLLTTASVCLARRNAMFSAGFSLGWASLLRVFPAFLLLPFIAAEGIRMWHLRTWTPSRDTTRLVTGTAMALATITVVASVVTSGRLFDTEAWRGFATNSQKHLESPLTNNMGLSVLVAFDPDERASKVVSQPGDAPWDAWTRARRQTFARRAPLFWSLAVVVVAMLGAGAAGRPPWVALALGVAGLPIAFELTSYYYAVLFVLGLLDERWVGIALSTAALATCLSAGVWDANDEIYAFNSAVVVVLVLAIAVAFANRYRSATTSLHASQSSS